VTARASAGSFWDEDFAWAPLPGPMPADSIFDVTFETELAIAVPARRRRAPTRRRVHLQPARFLSRAGLPVLLLALLVAAIWALGGREQHAAPRAKPKPAATTTPLPESAAPGAVNDPIAIGDQGEAVRALQQTLIALEVGAPGADGSFAGATRDAVFAFQRAHGLTADGVVGPETTDALRSALAERATSVAAGAREGLRSAVGANRVSREAGSRYEAILNRALEGFGGMPLAGAANLAAVLGGVAVQASAYDEPRALTLFSMLEANREALTVSPPPEKPADISGADGVVYRFFPARGYQFHPLANFGALNRHVSKGRSAEARRLAEALVARGVPDGKALLWEYFFPFGGPARWTSGFSQAVAADALLRAGALIGDPKVSAAAKAAFHSLPNGLSLELGGGSWVQEYSFSDIVILNAQLQTTLNVSRFAETSRDAEAQAFATALRTASRNVLPRFDKGCWSLYSLGGGNASPTYHRYHIRLLNELAAQDPGGPWREVARRWQGSC
jgi:D-glucuronyl C5-epimerase-like protein/putative peptidoglycan binding protein